MKRNRFRGQPWYPYTVAAAAGVVLYVLLTRWTGIWAGVGKVIGYFSPVLTGVCIAYLVDPLVRLFERRVFRRVRRENRRLLLAVLLAYITVLAFIALALLVLLPQLFQSISAFAENLDGYMESIRNVLNNWGIISAGDIDLETLLSSSEEILVLISDYALKNIKNIISSSAMVGNQLFQWGIGLLLSIYLLLEKHRLKAGLRNLLTALMGEIRFQALLVVLRRCNAILNRYIVYNLLDCLIVGVVNAVFMVAVGLPYVGLVSFVVAISNLLPTFGPIIGAVIGVFVLVLVKPWYAIAFLVFTLVLQTCDGYLIKPRLFGSSLGVSGLWILIGVIVGGRMFGILGILLAIPAVAMLDFVYREYFMPWLKGRRPSARTPGRGDLEEQNPPPE